MTVTIAKPRCAIRRLNIVGFSTIVLMLGGFGFWASTGQLAGAVIAPGVIVVETNVKKVQHSTGGIIGQILVQEGDVVRAGDVVMRLEDTLTRSTLGVVRAQLDELQAREARLIAERDGDDAIHFSEALLSRPHAMTLETAMAGEERLFQSRRQGRIGQRSQLRERILQINEEIRGLTAQQTAKDREIDLIADELVGVRQLFGQSLVSISRLMLLQRDQARLSGERGQYVADVARARGKISETEIAIIQLDQDFRTEVLKDLREGQGKIAELQQRFVAAEDQLKRIEIRAPQTGTVLQLAVHTIGGVVANGETLMMIVPNNDSLVVDAKVSPQDVDQLVTGAKAIVRVMAGNQRTMPDLEGRLLRVSADLAHDSASSGQSSTPYYQVRISLPRSETERLENLRLVPGMPTEVFIQTYSRTMMQYLLKPLYDQIARTFRER